MNRDSITSSRASDCGPISKCGILCKRGTAYRHNWKCRWFEIDRDTLIYYSYNEESKLKAGSRRGSFILTRHSKVERAKIFDEHISPRSSFAVLKDHSKTTHYNTGNDTYSHVFLLSNILLTSGTPLDTLVLAADSEESMNEWIDMIDSIIVYALYQHMLACYRLDEPLSGIPCGASFPVDIIFDTSGYVTPGSPTSPLSDSSSPLTTLSLKGPALANSRLTVPNLQKNEGYDLRSIDSIGRSKPVLKVGRCSPNENLWVSVVEGQPPEPMRYTVLLVNLDFQRKHNDTRECFINWMAVNSIVSSDRHFLIHDTICEYVPPTPTWNSGPNRMLLVVARQTGLISPESVQHLKPQIDRCNEVSIYSLHKQLRLGTICAVSAFRAQWDPCVDAVLSELEITLHAAHQSPEQETLAGLGASTVEMSEQAFVEVLSSLKAAYKMKAQEAEALTAQVQSLKQQLDIELQVSKNVIASERQRTHSADLVKELEDELALNHQLITTMLAKDTEIEQLRNELAKLQSFENEAICEVKSFIEDFCADESIHKVRGALTDCVSDDHDDADQLSVDINELRHQQSQRLLAAESEIERLAIECASLQRELSLKDQRIAELESINPGSSSCNVLPSYSHHEGIIESLRETIFNINNRICSRQGVPGSAVAYASASTTATATLGPPVDHPDSNSPLKELLKAVTDLWSIIESQDALLASK